MNAVPYSTETDGRSSYGPKINYMPVESSVTFVNTSATVLTALPIYMSQRRKETR
jgi:hypothetical protein